MNSTHAWRVSVEPMRLTAPDFSQIVWTIHHTAADGHDNARDPVAIGTASTRWEAYRDAYEALAEMAGKKEAAAARLVTPECATLNPGEVLT